jgi:hypothetical protein
MKLFTAALLLAALPAYAQDNGVTIVPPPPPIVTSTTPPQGAAPITPSPVTPTQVGQAPPAYDNGASQPAPDQSATTATPAAPPATTPPAPPNDWVPGTTAVLGVLNKVDGSTANVTIAVGGQATVGDLQVSVLACVNRPPTEIPDTAIFISTANAPGATNAALYRGWMVRSTPGATVAGDADEIFRVVSCT